MSSGKFWSGVLPANNDQDTGATPAGKVRSVNIVAVNTGALAVTLKVYIGTNAAPAVADRIEPDISLPAGGIYRLTGEPVGAGERVILNTSGANVTARVSGFEEVA